MNIEALLSPERVQCHTASTSKKRALEKLSELLASGTDGLTASEIFDSLLSRERLGSTGLGHGVAIPHGRTAGASKAVAALVTLDGGVDYDAPDHKPVDILFALVVPEASTDEHLQTLAQLAQMFSDEQMTGDIRDCRDAHCLVSLIGKWEARQAA